MIVRCNIDHLDPSVHAPWLCAWANQSALEVTRGTRYPVVDVSRYAGNYFVYVQGDEPARYPLAFPIALFEVVDGRVPASWNLPVTSVATVGDLGLDDQEVCSFADFTKSCSTTTLKP
jgi:hypothetical protein